jgi:tight adherence protein C
MLATLAALFVSVSVLTGSIALYVASSASTERRRLRSAMRPPPTTALPEILTVSSAEPDSAWQRVGKMLPRSPKEMTRLRQRLSRAGFRHPGAAVVYSLLELVAPLVIGALPLFFLHGTTAWLAAGGAAIVTFFLPGLVVERQLAKRRREIENGLPDALDLIVVCIEAGSGIDQAIVKTSDELALTYPRLAEELRIVITEIRAGKPRIEAFKNLAQRTKVNDVRSLVAMLVQTDRFGTSVGQALRTHADVSRTKRRQRAEERAQKIGVKLVFPLVFFFFPALYVVILGPAVIQFMHSFLNK